MVLDDLESRERRYKSQNGEDGVIAAIFTEIGITNRYFVEFGSGDGSENNTARLLDQGWSGLWMDGFNESCDPRLAVRNEYITAENIHELLNQYGVPSDFDLLSLDLDGNDFWVWRQIRHRPRVAVLEYNATVPPHLCRTIRYDPDFQWSGSDYFGASLLALEQLGRHKGYTLVYCEWTGTNSFFVADEALPAGYARRPVAEIYRPPNYFGSCQGHPPDATQTMIDPLVFGDHSLRFET